MSVAYACGVKYGQKKGRIVLLHIRVQRYDFFDICKFFCNLFAYIRFFFVPLQSNKDNSSEMF